MPFYKLKYEWKYCILLLSLLSNYFPFLSPCTHSHSRSLRCHCIQGQHWEVLPMLLTVLSYLCQNKCLPWLGKKSHCERCISRQALLMTTGNSMVNNVITQCLLNISLWEPHGYLKSHQISGNIIYVTLTTEVFLNFILIFQF